jgi:DNA adenine methylase
VEPFGGSGAVLLARNASKIEVFNDRYAGVTAFYRCIRDRAKLDRLCEWLDLTVHSREDFVWCKDTWENVADDIERAARWFYMINYSFASKGACWGRSTSAGGMAGKVRNKIKAFQSVHERLKCVQIENQDWSDCLRDYDNSETVFYLDPPYIDASPGTYKHELSKQEHTKLLDAIFSLKGFVALSGYANPFYDERDWDSRHEWDVFISIKSAAYSEGNNKAHLKGIEERGHGTEVLWIKEAK